MIGPVARGGVAGLIGNERLVDTPRRRLLLGGHMEARSGVDAKRRNSRSELELGIEAAK